MGTEPCYKVPLPNWDSNTAWAEISCSRGVPVQAQQGMAQVKALSKIRLGGHLYATQGQWGKTSIITLKCVWLGAARGCGSWQTLVNCHSSPSELSWVLLSAGWQMLSQFWHQWSPGRRPVTSASPKALSSLLSVTILSAKETEHIIQTPSCYQSHLLCPHSLASQVWLRVTFLSGQSITTL